MKKLLAAGLALFCSLSFLWAEVEPGVIPAEPAPPLEDFYVPGDYSKKADIFQNRIFEWGIVNVNITAANTLLSWSDVFNSAKTLKIDLDKLPKDTGLGAGVSGKVQTWFRLRLRGRYEPDFTLTFGVEFDGYAGLSKDLTEKIADGLPVSFHGTGDSGASVFAATEFKGAFKINRWRIFAAPEFYLPLVYMTKPDMHLNINTADPNPGGELTVKGDIYSSFSLKDMNVAGIQNSLGLNVSFGAEYPLFDFLDVGAALYHVPLIPATLHHKASFNFGYDIDTDGKKLIDIIDSDFSDLFKERGSLTDLTYSDANYHVLRPIRFNGYGVYKPLRDERISIRGDMGFSVLTVYGPCFNMEVSAKARWRNVFTFDLGTGWTEKMWRHKASFIVNMRVLELELGAGLASQSFLKSFQATGFQAVVGLRAGY